VIRLALLLFIVAAGFGAMLFSRRASASEFVGDGEMSPEMPGIVPDILPEFSFQLPDIPEEISFGAIQIPDLNVPNFLGFGTEPDNGNGVLSSMNEELNVSSFLSMIVNVEARGRWDLISGNDVFTDFSDHPFNIDPSRRRPAGTTASGGYQIVRGTWNDGVRYLAKNGIIVPDFSPESQTLLTREYILKVKRRGAYDLIAAGRFTDALGKLRGEWEAFDKMLAGTYPISIGTAQAMYTNNGGMLA